MSGKTFGLPAPRSVIPIRLVGLDANVAAAADVGAADTSPPSDIVATPLISSRRSKKNTSSSEMQEYVFHFFSFSNFLANRQPKVSSPERTPPSVSSGFGGRNRVP